ncbi:MAG: hypothetical protein FJ403_08630 [Verrucomicrobia bacterium]|nr:hypothetical protein [Verrucomicrobiota bacterium]
MSKPVLGRGLGSLLNESGPRIGSRSDPASVRADAGPAVDHGLRTLINANKAENRVETSGDLARPAKLKIPAWYFFVLDLLLLIFVGLLVVTSSPLDGLRLFLCGAAVVLGAVLSGMAIWSNSQTAPEKAAGHQTAKWVLAESQGENGSSKRFVVHLQKPLFVGELVENQQGDEAVKPLWVEDKSALSDALVGQIKREVEALK